MLSIWVWNNSESGFTGDRTTGASGSGYYTANKLRGIVIHILSAQDLTRIQYMLTSQYRPLVSNFKAKAEGWMLLVIKILNINIK